MAGLNSRAGFVIFFKARVYCALYQNTFSVTQLTEISLYTQSMRGCFFYQSFETISTAEMYKPKQ